jgi:outer membrane lipoprotein-sorting protein
MRIPIALAFAFAAAAATPDAQALLERSDLTRNAWPSFTVRVKITSFEAGQPDESYLYQVYQKGPEKTYVEFLSPREKGRHLLMLGDDMWIFLPDTKRPIRITPLERLRGNASNGDVARTNYATDYHASHLRTEKAGDADCHVLELAARRRGSTYRRIVLWLRVSDARPMKADFYLASGKHVKSATFDRYESAGGRTLLRRMTIYDQIRKTSHSVMEYQDYTPRNLPDRMFHQGRSERF